MVNISQLSSELILEIFTYTCTTVEECYEQSFILNLLPVCKRWRSLGEDILYRDITFLGEDTINPCWHLHRLLQTLVGRPDLASRVTSLKIGSLIDFIGIAEKGLEERLIQDLGLSDQDAWLNALEKNVTGVFVGLILLQTPNLRELNLCVRDGFEFAVQPLDPKFRAPASGLASTETGTYFFSALESFSCGSEQHMKDPISTTYPIQRMAHLFSLPNITFLKLFSLHGDNSFTWPQVERPTAKRLTELRIDSSQIDMDVVGELVLACPSLKAFTYLAQENCDRQHTLYQKLARFLEPVKSTLEQFTVRCYDFPGSYLEEGQETTASPDDFPIEPIDSLAGFDRLERLTTSPIALIGSDPPIMRQLDGNFWPRALKRLDVYDDTWLVESLLNAVFWGNVMADLIDLLLHKPTWVPCLEEVRIFVAEREPEAAGLGDEFAEYRMVLSEVGESVGVKTSLWIPE